MIPVPGGAQGGGGVGRHRRASSHSGTVPGGSFRRRKHCRAPLTVTRSASSGSIATTSRRSSDSTRPMQSNRAAGASRWHPHKSRVSHISLSAVERTILETSGVDGVHDLHVWTISSGIEALSADISHDESVLHSELLVRVRERLHERFGIDHLTIQMETLGREAEAVYVCATDTKCFKATQV